MSKDLAKLEHLLGYKFQNLARLERAVTHRSWAHEHLPDGDEEKIRELQNESFEFVGDSVLGLAIAEQLYLKNPTVSEGDLTLMKHHLVSTETLARIATALDLGEFMRVGRGEEKTGGRRKQALLADGYEALIAAIYLDGGVEQVLAFIARQFEALINEARAPGAAFHDHKSALQERVQSSGDPPPEYVVIGETGPDHHKKFQVQVRVGGTPIAEAGGRSKKEAEQEAARLALEYLKSKN